MREAAQRRAKHARVARSIEWIDSTFPEGTKGLSAHKIDAIIDTLCWTNFRGTPARRRKHAQEYAEEARRLLKRHGLFVLHFRPSSSAVPIVCSPETQLPTGFLRCFEWSRLVLTHLAENRFWKPSDARKRGGRHLQHDWAVVYVGIGRPRAERSL